MADPINTHPPYTQSWWDLERIRQLYMRYVGQYIQVWLKPLVSFLLSFALVSGFFAAFKSFFSPKHLQSASAAPAKTIENEDESKSEDEGESQISAQSAAGSLTEDLEQTQELELRMLLKLSPMEQIYYLQFLLRKVDFLLLLIHYQLKSPHLTPDMRLQLTYSFLNLLMYRDTLNMRLVHICETLMFSLLLLNTVSERNDFRMRGPRPQPRISEVEEQEEKLLRDVPKPQLQPPYAPHDDSDLDNRYDDYSSYPVANVPEGYRPPVLQPAYNPEYVPGSPQVELAPEDVASVPENLPPAYDEAPPAYEAPPSYEQPNQPTQSIQSCYYYKNVVVPQPSVPVPMPAPSTPALTV